MFKHFNDALHDNKYVNVMLQGDLPIAIFFFINLVRMRTGGLSKSARSAYRAKGVKNCQIRN